MIIKELRDLTIDEFIKIGEAHCTRSLGEDHRCCTNKTCPFHNRWSCDVYDLLIHVQEEEYHKKYEMPGKPDVDKLLADRQRDLQLQYVNYCEDVFQLQHKCIRNLIGLDSNPMSKKDKANVLRKNLNKWRDGNDQTT